VISITGVVRVIAALFTADAPRPTARSARPGGSEGCFQPHIQTDCARGCAGRIERYRYGVGSASSYVGHGDTETRAVQRPCNNLAQPCAAPVTMAIWPVTT